MPNAVVPEPSRNTRLSFQSTARDNMALRSVPVLGFLTDIQENQVQILSLAQGSYFLPTK